MTPFPRPLAVLLRTVAYVAILVGAWLVANVTGASATVFTYQGF